MAMRSSALRPTSKLWRSTRGKSLVTSLALPVFYLLNRPSLAWFARAAYDFALRCNGIAINFHGSHGLTIGEERFARAHLAGLSGGILFDVGANNGAYALYLRRVAPQSRIYAFEPHPATFAALQTRIAGASVTAIQSAVSDTAGTATLFDFATADGSTQASLDEDALQLFDTDTVAHEVPVTTIDDFMAAHEITRINLLKIDTEGLDIAVLRGAAQALANQAIDAIQFEFIPANIACRVTMRDFFEVLVNYRLFRLCMNGALLPLNNYDVKTCEIYVTQNLIALPASR